MKVTNLKQALAMIEAVKQLQYPEELKVQNGSKYSFFITHLDGMIGVRQNRQTTYYPVTEISKIVKRIV